MQACKLTITTTADGVENSITREGEMELALSSASIRYREENACVLIQLEGETADIERVGDYTLKLRLKRGEWTKGELGIGGSSGEVDTYAHRVGYSFSDNSILLLLHYDLMISGEKQEMKLRILSRFKEEIV